MKSIFIALITILWCSCSVLNKGTSSEQSRKSKYLVVLSLDGFRWDYNKLYNTPTLDSIATEGSKVERLIPSFPSKTFPNHYTLVTGLTPDHHGVVSNAFYSPSHKDYYTLSDRSKVQNGSYYGGEPIWVTAEKQNVKSACYFWPGSEAEIKGVRPSIWKRYDDKVSYKARMDSVLNWLMLPEKDRPHLCLFYFDQPDKAGHQFGPNSEEVKMQVESIDKLLSYFTYKLNQLPIKDSIDFIIVSDHGMDNVSFDRLVVINEVIDSTDVTYALGSNPVIFLSPKEGKYDKVKSELQKKEGVSVWSKSEIPQHLAFGDNENISPLIVLADSSWSVTIERPINYFGGTHGYDPSNLNMSCILYGVGPSFKQSYVAPPMSNINVYNIMSYVLGITPSINDGKISYEMFKK